jgi:anti-sigma factor ChrR (cupin superfamily)
MREIHVDCYAGYRADERPLRFTLGERSYEVIVQQGRWYSPGVSWFRVRADDGNVYVLRHDEGQDVWTLDAFRTVGAAGS